MKTTGGSAGVADREPVEGDRRWPIFFAGVFGLCLGLTLAKLGNPVILDAMVEPPGGFLEAVFNSWPVAWGYGMLALSFVAALPVLRSNRQPAGIVILLPLIWLVWQILAATRSIDSRLSTPTIIHFGGCVLCFFLGQRALRPGRPTTLFWSMILLCFVWVLWIGFTQKFGGLEATRRYISEQVGWENLPPDYVKRIQSGRVFSTFVYPNALAGAVLLLLPPLVVITWRTTSRLSNVPRGIITGLLAYGALACLVWSGSKSGWLIALVVGSAAVIRFGGGSRSKWIAVGLLCLLGVGAFATRYRAYFEKGATSVGARMDYWNAAWRIALANPVFGTGPGTFSVTYREIKAPDSEMTRLVHNDFLEQASDSGWVGFLAYAAFVGASLVFLARRSRADWLKFAAWLGILGWSLQGMVEFGLYIPALAWLAFAILGWLWSLPPNGFDIRTTRS